MNTQRRDRSASLPFYLPEQITRRRGSSGLHDLSENLPHDYDPERHVDRFHHYRPDSGRPMNLLEEDGHHASSIRIGASVVGGNIAHLGAECRRLRNIGADFLRFDMIDGSFCPGELTLGPSALAAVRKYLGPNAILDAHLMVANPAPYIDTLKAAGASRIVLQYESATAEQLTNILANIRDSGMKAGLAILPKTAVGLLLTFADVVDFAVVLTAEPTAPDKFIPLAVDKVKAIHKEHPTLEIEVSGAIGPGNIQGCAAAGATSFVASALATDSADPAVTWHQMHVHLLRDSKERRPSYHLSDYYNLDDEIAAVEEPTVQPADQTKSLSLDDLETYLKTNKGRLSNNGLDELLKALSGKAPTSSDTDAVSNFKPPKQIEEPVNNIPARGSDAAQPSLSDKRRVLKLWELEERGRLAFQNKTGVKDGKSSEDSTEGFDFNTYCKQDRLPLMDPRTMKPVPCSVNGNKCPSEYSCDATTSKSDGFCCMSAIRFPVDSTSSQSEQEKEIDPLNYCRKGYVPLTGCQPNAADACYLLQGAVCDTTAKFATPTSGFCCLPAMAVRSTTTTTTTTATTTTPTTTLPTSTSTTSSTTTSLRSTADLYCGNKGVLVEFIAVNVPRLKRCSTSSDCSKGFDCDQSGVMVRDRFGYCCSKLPAVAVTTTTPKAPKAGNSAGTILLSSGMLLLVVLAAAVSYSVISK
uniref:ribulose-phosphate 3-epimerase n=1 Tax=Plectus sambesii TaxID=2011161 RepID=A0A914UJF8_9BILA